MDQPESNPAGQPESGAPGAPTVVDAALATTDSLADELRRATDAKAESPANSAHPPASAPADSSIDQQVTIDTAVSPSANRQSAAFSWDPGAEQPPSQRPKEFPFVAGYEILRELGRGGMGVVYLAKHRGLKREVALKMLLGGGHAGPDQLNRFRVEAESVAKLQHVNIVKIFDVGEQDGLPYFSLEFVDGGALDQRIAGKSMSENDAAAMVETLARAMHYAHAQGIVHRDLKPGNVLLTAQGEPRITDFGLVKRLEGDHQGTTRTGAIMGTPSFMAPEQGRGEKDVGPLADVYALGSILYNMLTGRPPFLAATAVDTLMHLLNDEPVPPSSLQPEISRDIETICLKCLQKDPARRYASAMDLADDLRRFLNNEPILALPVGRIEFVWRWCRRRPLVAGLSALAITLALIVLIGAPIAAWRIADERDEAIAARNFAKEAQEAAEQARGMAEENAQRAKDAQHEADQNARSAAEQRGLALEALGTLVTKVQNRLRETPATQQLKQDLLLTGLEGLRKVAESAQGSHAADAMMAEAHQRMGDIFQSLAQHAEAREQYEKGYAIRQALASQSPPSADAQSNLALALTKLGDISLLQGDRSQAQRYYVEALQLRESLAAGQPDNKAAQVNLATSFVKIGGVSEPDEARSYFVRALEIRQALAADIRDPTRLNRERDVWITFNKLAELSLRLKDFAAATNYYEQALDQAVTLQLLVPESARAKTDLALSHIHLGDVRERQQAFEQAMDSYGQALVLLRPLAAEDPKNLEVQTNLFLVLARHGDFAEAIKGAEMLRGLAPSNHLNLYNVACCYALCAKSLERRNAQTPAAPDDIANLQKYVNQAIGTLRLAVTCGLKNPESVTADPDLDAIRGHVDYPKLLAELE